MLASKKCFSNINRLVQNRERDSNGVDIWSFEEVIQSFTRSRIIRVKVDIANSLS